MGLDQHAIAKNLRLFIKRLKSAVLEEGQEAADSSLPLQIKTLMLLRVVLVTLLLALTAYLQWREQVTQVNILNRSMVSLYSLCGLIYLLTCLYGCALIIKMRLRYLAYLQLTIDVLIVTSLIYLTNGYDIYTFLFIVTIFSAAIILGRRGALFIGVFSGLNYNTLLLLFYYGIIPNIAEGHLESKDFARFVIINPFYFVGAAFLSGSLSQQLTRIGKRLAEKQANLRDLENLNRNIVQSLPSGLLTVNSDMYITSFNRAAEEITGLTFADVFNQPLRAFFPHLVERLHHGEHRWEELFVRKPSQEQLVLGFSRSPLVHHDGRSLGQIINFQNVTYVRQMQEQMRQNDKLAAVGRLAAGIAHEIRNPLASISGSIQMLKEELNPEGENRRLMDIVNRETQRLNILIRDFLDFAKPQRKEIRLVSLNEIVLETTKVSHQQILAEDKGNVNIEVDIIPAAVSAKIDSGKIKQVLWNLLLNAYQAIQGSAQKAEGEVTVHLSLDEETKERRAILKVSDNGCGIPAESREFIFEPFYTTKIGGTGLGLATVRKIAEESGWQVTFESQLGKGTTFCVAIPLEPAGSESGLGNDAEEFSPDSADSTRTSYGRS